MTDHFSFKQFTIWHDRCAMKVGTDGVLLGAWANIGKRMLDVGSGSGLIALMLAQRMAKNKETKNAEWSVEGVEIDHDAAMQSQENIACSPFASRVCIHPLALEHYKPQHQIDAIASNPPFFFRSQTNDDSRRTTARHAPEGFFPTLFVRAKQWLTDEGELSLIIPWDSVEEVATEAYLRGFMLTRRIALRTKNGRPFERCLIAFAKTRHNPAEIGEQTLLTDDGQRSAWYEELTRDFYLSSQ